MTIDFEVNIVMALGQFDGVDVGKPVGLSINSSGGRPFPGVYP